MTFAPASLLADRRYLLDTYDMHPGDNDHTADLDPAEVGIVGDSAHRGGYHCGADRVDPGDYSATARRDKRGLSLAASALDIGMFSVKGADGETYNWRDLSVWIVAQCRKGAKDALDIREVIYTDDGKRVLRWDQRNGQSSPPHAGEADNSHLTHTHISRYRDAQDRRLTPLFERWHAEIMGDDVALTDEDVDKIVNGLLSKKLEVGAEWLPVFPADPGVQDGTVSVKTTWLSGYFWKRQADDPASVPTASRMADLEAKVDQILAALGAGTPLPPAGTNTSATFTGTVEFGPATPPTG